MSQLDLGITVVGLGLMGGSLAGALRGRCRWVAGVDREPDVVEHALDTGLVDRGTVDLAAGVSEAGLVVVATPVRAIMELVREVGRHLADGCLLMDLGSTKGEILRAMAELPSHAHPLGGHPMCGRETSGIREADPALYQDKVFLLCPLQRTPPEGLALGERLVRAVGARPVVLEAERHDKLVSLVSHLPYLLACALVGAADEEAAHEPLVWQAAATGFASTSRLAGSDVTMMVDILLTNREAILHTLSGWERHLSHLARLVKEADEEALRATLSLVCDRRRAMGPTGAERRS